jgi:MoxR-like ATPase
VERMLGLGERASAVLDPTQLRDLQRAADAVYVDPGIIQYAVTLTGATRDPGLVGRDDLRRFITFGASPRASINMVVAGRALAYLRGRTYARPEDVRDLALDVLRHRLVLSYEALADNVDPDAILGPILAAVRMPEINVGPPPGQVSWHRPSP